MNRRGFLGLLGKAAAGAAVVYSFPSIIVPKNIEQVLSPGGVWMDTRLPAVGLRGIPYLINSTGNYFGLSRSVISSVILPGSGEEEWFSKLPKDRSLIPGDYHRTKAV